MENKDTKNAYVRQVAEQKYEYGFTTDVHTDIIEKGLNEDIVRLISSKKGEPDWMLEFRLQAFRHWQTLKEPKWGHVHVPEIDYQAISYYADPLAKKKNENKEIDPELMKTFDKLGIPLEEPRRERHHLLLNRRRHKEPSRPRARVLGKRGALPRQLLRSAQQRRVL